MREEGKGGDNDIGGGGVASGALSERSYGGGREKTHSMDMMLRSPPKYLA